MIPRPVNPRDFLASAAEGTRVVVRYRLADGFTDALGFLLACDGSNCTVRTRNADVDIPLSAVVAAKAVPPAPERRTPRASSA